MKKSKGKVLYGVIGFLGLITAVVPLSVYYLIETASMHMRGAPMDCFAACVAGTVIGGLIAVIAVVSLFFRNTIVEVSSSALLLLGGFAVIIVPRILGFCAHEVMACHYITAPTLAILGSAIIALSAVRLASGVLTIRKASAAA